MLCQELTKAGLPKKKMGRPRKELPLEVLAQDDMQAFESARKKWNYLSLHLAEQAIASAKGDKKNLTQIVTSAAIAMDKAFSKRDSGEVTINIPASLQGAISLALRLEPAQRPIIANYVNSQVPDSVTVGAEGYSSSPCSVQIQDQLLSKASPCSVQAPVQASIEAGTGPVPGSGPNLDRTVG
jgi:hypothetical protein